MIQVIFFIYIECLFSYLTFPFKVSCVLNEKGNMIAYLIKFRSAQRVARKTFPYIQVRQEQTSFVHLHPLLFYELKIQIVFHDMNIGGGGL